MDSEKGAHMLKKLFSRKLDVFPWIAKLEEGPVLKALNDLKGEKENFDPYIPVRLGPHLYYSALYYIKKIKNPEMSKLVIVNEKGTILKDKAKAYKVCLAVNLFIKVATIENIQYIGKNIEELDEIKKIKSKAAYHVPTAKLFLSKKDAETLEKSLNEYYKNENTAKQLLMNYIEGLNRIRTLDSIDYKDFMELVDSYIDAGLRRVKAKENILKFSELMILAKKTVPEKEDEYLETKEGAYYMLDRLDSYVRKDVALLQHAYKNIREFYAKKISEDEVKSMLEFFNKNV